MRCVYTVLLGGYESLTEQPVALSSSIDFICLTDDPKLTSDTWKVEVVDPLLADDLIRSQRYLKIMGSDLLKRYSETLYIDNSVLLRRRPEEIFEKYTGRACLALPLHSFRSSVRDEFREVESLHLDNPEIIARQRQRYEELVPAVFNEKPYWTGILIRDYSNPQLQVLMSKWWEDVREFSRRDQLSINASIVQTRAEIHSFELANNKSWFHKWPVAKNRRNDLRHFLGRVPVQPGLIQRILRYGLHLARKLKVKGQK
jgi:hypothetical protein